MAVCRTAARGNTFIWIYVILYAGGGAFNTMLSNKILMKLLTVFFGPMPPHVLCGLRGPPSWAWQECNRLLRLGRS